MKNELFFGQKVIKSLFSRDEILQIQKEVDVILGEQDRAGYIWKFFDTNSGFIKRIEYFINYNAFFKNLSKSQKILKEIRNIINEEPILFKDKINLKYKNMSNFAPHQDICAGWDKYCDYQITVAIPLCDTNADNGGICYGKKTDKKLTPAFKDLPKFFPLEKPIETNLGDVIIFDSYVPHASYNNNTERPRIILFFTYNKKSDGDHYEVYHSDKFKVVPPDISKIKGKKYKSGNSNEQEFFYNKDIK